MKNSMLLLTLGLVMGSALAAPYQLTKEAELASGGTVTVSPGASGNSAVTRSTDGSYSWWISGSTGMTTGSYSVYARIALAPGTTTARQFGLFVNYGDVQLATQGTSISNKAYKWMRIGGFDLKATGSPLRISDWSAPGLSLDKLAIVKDISIEAESVTQQTIFADTAASGQKAVTSASGGIYTWWSPATAEMSPGDYTAYASIASTDGASHKFNEIVSLNSTDKPSVSAAVSSTGYQWYKLNDFVYSAKGQTVRLSDYSESKLKVDRIKLVRATPYEENSTAQTLFAAGDYALGPREEVVFRGKPNGIAELQTPARVALVQASPGKVYAYLRQELIKDSRIFEMYAAVSSDGGLTFDLIPEPIMTRAQTKLGTLLDPSVTKRVDGYYMIFEGSLEGCSWSARAAFSADGLTNWQFLNTPVCTTNWDIGAGVPNYFVDVETDSQYIQWSANDSLAHTVTLHQAPIEKLFEDKLSFGSVMEMAKYAMPRAAPGNWDYVNRSSSNVFYEDGYYYLVHDGANNSECTGQWGLGIMRTATPTDRNSWVSSPAGPIIMASKTDNCWLGAPSLTKINNITYYYYLNPEVYYVPNGVNIRTIFRHRLIQK